MEEIPVFLTKEKLTPVSSIVWDMTGRLEDMDKLYTHLKSDFEVTKGVLEGEVEIYKTRSKLLSYPNEK